MRNHFLFISISVLTALLVVFLLFSSNNIIIKTFSFFWPDPYAGKMILFYGEGCDQCEKVDEFIKNNRIEDKIAFVRLEVFNNSHNENVLLDKAKRCGLEERQIGVPFIFDDHSAKCVLGSIDVIHFFKLQLQK